MRIYQDQILVDRIIPIVGKIDDQLKQNRRANDRQNDLVKHMKLSAAVDPRSLYDLLQLDGLQIHS